MAISTKTFENYSEVYDKVMDFEVKKELDREMASLVVDSFGGERLGGCGLIEIGCGHAPISRLLGKNVKECIGLDLSDKMHNSDGQMPHNNFSFVQDDICSPLGVSIAEHLERDGKKNTFVWENGWYAVTVPDDPKHQVAPDVALWLRRESLLNVASMMKPGEEMILTDPLASARDLSSKSIAKFLKTELQLRTARTGKVRAMGEIAQMISNKQVRETLRQNKLLTSSAHLFGNVDEMAAFIGETNMFEVEVISDQDYLGHNATLRLRRTIKPVINPVSSCTEIPTLPMPNGTVVVKTGKGIVDQTIMRRVGEIRIAGYDRVNPALEISSSWDDVNGAVGLVSSHDSQFPIATMTLTMGAGENGGHMEIGEIMKGKKCQFDPVDLTNRIISADPRLDGLKPSQVGEIRRLVTIGALPAVKRFASSSEEAGKENDVIIADGMKKLISGLLTHAIENDIKAVTFITKPQIATRLRPLLKPMGVTFNTLDGFELNRRDVDVQTLIVVGCMYFLDMKKGLVMLDESERRAFDFFRQQLVEARLEDETCKWTDIIAKMGEGSDLAEKAVRKLLTSAPDGIQTYYFNLNDLRLS